MLSKKKVKTISKIMFKNSFRAEYLDESKMRLVLAVISKAKTQGVAQILKAYRRLIEQQIAREHVLVESPVKLDAKLEKEIMTKTKARKLEYLINSQLVSGAKVTHGDWVFDSTLDSKLSQLTMNY